MIKSHFAQKLRLIAFLLLAFVGQSICASVKAENIVLPIDNGIIDVTAPYNADNTGTTNCTAALQQAIRDNIGQRHTLYFRNGTYLEDHNQMVGAGIAALARDAFERATGASQEKTRLSAAALKPVLERIAREAAATAELWPK